MNENVEANDLLLTSCNANACGYDAFRAAAAIATNSLKGQLG